MARLLCRLAVGCFLASCLGCDGATKVAGRIQDQDSRPIAEATVTIRTQDSGDKDRSVSRPDGSCGVMTTHAPGDYELVFEVEKAGHEPHRETVPSGTWKDSHDVMLERDQ